MAKLNKKAPYGGCAGASAQAAGKRLRMVEMVDYLNRGLSTNNIAAALGISLSTAQNYRRELIRTGRWKPKDFRNTSARHEFLRANIHRPLEWFVEFTGLAPSTLARDLKKLGRTDIKLSSHVTGKGKITGKNELLSREFMDCEKWNSVYRAMTTKREVAL